MAQPSPNSCKTGDSWGCSNKNRSVFVGFIRKVVVLIYAHLELYKLAANRASWVAKEPTQIRLLCESTSFRTSFFSGLLSFMLVFHVFLCLAEFLIRYTYWFQHFFDVCGAFWAPNEATPRCDFYLSHTHSRDEFHGRGGPRLVSSLILMIRKGKNRS